MFRYQLKKEAQQHPKRGKDGRIILSTHDTLEEAKMAATAHGVPETAWSTGFGGRHWLAGGNIEATFRGRFMILAVDIG